MSGRILLIGTGGTISCVKTENGLSPGLGIDELIGSVAADGIEIVTEQIFSLDSTNMTPRHWEQLARLIREHYNEFDGFVILHGTDTMAYAAASLSCLIRNPRKPIVFTGSMMPMTMEYSDAPENLRKAIKFAADECAFGVNVVFSGRIYDGQSVSKADSDSLEPFFSLNNEEREGYWIDGQLVFNRQRNGETRFYERLSDDVFHVKLIPGQELSVPSGVRALILENYGLGGIPEYLTEDVSKLAESGVYIIVATQCDYGGTNLGKYAVGHVDFPIIEAGKYTVEYAVARARWALEYSSGFEEFRRLFCEQDFFDSN